jgi:DNA recombination protein RmuC
LNDRVLNLQKHFGQTSEDIRHILVSAEKIEKRAGRIREVEFSGGEASEARTIESAAPARLAASR